MAVTTAAALRTKLGIALAELGVSAEFCEGGTDAVAVCTRDRPDLVILDLDRPGTDLPGKDAAEFCRVLSSTLADWDGALLVLVDASDGTGKKVSRALAAGARDYLLKPITFEKLSRKIALLLPDGPGADTEPVDIRENIAWKLIHDETFPIDHYVIDGKLGRGGMATIYSAVDERTGRHVALKVLSPVYNRNPGLLQRFLDEIEVIMGIAHPHIVQFYEVGQFEGAHYAAMEVVDGGSLKDTLELVGTLEVDTALYITECVASALAELHRYRIVHRDVKPGNILISSSEDGAVKLVDFGLAKSNRDRRVTRTGMVLGTPRYIAPEQAREGGHADIRADIYSLGITLYQMLTGSAPFISDDTHEVLTKHLSETAIPVGDRVDGLPQAVGRLVSLMIAKSPDDRFQTPNQLMEGIELARRGLDPVAAIPSEFGPALARAEPSSNGKNAARSKGSGPRQSQGGAKKKAVAKKKDTSRNGRGKKK